MVLISPLFFTKLWGEETKANSTMAVGICASTEMNLPPDPAVTVVFAASSFDAAVSAGGGGGVSGGGGGVHHAVPCSPFIRLKWLAGCCFRAARGENNKEKQHLV